MLFAGVLFAAAVAGADWINVGEGGAPPTQKNIEQILRQRPLGPNENIRVTPLAQNGRSSQVLVQIREREPMHYHADSDITVLLLRGHGMLRLVDNAVPMRTGDVLHVPRGVMHAFVNQGAEIAAALVIYSPAPGPNDRVLTEPHK
jgi:quercetin dioxygenase-like cupin family protein